MTSKQLFGDLLSTLPEEYLQIRTRKSLVRLVSTLLIGVALYFGLAYGPWYTLPLCWFLLGAVFSGLRGVSYACKWGSFSRYPIVNSLIGNVVSFPLLAPFEALKTFQAKQTERLESASFWWTSSVGEWWGMARSTIESQSTYFKLWFPSRVVTLVGMIYYFGFWGFCKFWFFPWLVYHFWMSAFITLSYYQPKSEESIGTIVFHCKFPNWVEYLSNDMSYVLTSACIGATKIPHHHLRKAYSTMKNCETDIKEIPVMNAMREVMKDDAAKFRELAKKINWGPAIFLIFIHIAAVWGIINVPLKKETGIFALITYFYSGLGITAGYHRLWSHKAYDVNIFSKIVFMLMGTSGLQGSVIWWARDHRAHHRFSDTEKDPYGVQNGLMWAHMGWLFFKKDSKIIGKTDISDLLADKVLVWQHKNYAWFSLVVSFLFPTLFCGYFFDDYWGGYFWAGVIRGAGVLQATWCINSLAHYLGDATYSDQRSSRDSWIVSLITFGEGYHCFHHEFPYDYRNGITTFAYDPTKWLIYGLSLVGMSTNLKRFPENEIQKGAYLMELKKLNEKKSKLKWGPEIEKLPKFTLKQVEEDVAKGASLMVINNLVHDCTNFIGEHPGGEAFIRTKLGKDATASFNGGVYAHSLAANNVLELMRVGRIVEDKSE
jgi:stearoyl-CoA desaturase (delta-9 desaturase)